MMYNLTSVLHANTVYFSHFVVSTYDFIITFDFMITSDYFQSHFMIALCMYAWHGMLSIMMKYQM